MAPLDGRIKKLSVNAKVPLTVGKDAVNGASKVRARSNSADAADGTADTDEYTFGFGQKEVLLAARYNYHFLQDLTCTYPEDTYTHVQYSWESSSNIGLYQDANNELGYGAGRIYICNPDNETGTLTITATLMNGDDAVASDSYTANVIIDFAFSETSATAILGRPFTVPTLTNRYSGTSVTYTSSNTDVATVDENGGVNPVALGETTITATLDSDNSITASYTLTVENLVVSLPYEKSFADGMDDFTIIDNGSEEGAPDAWMYDSENQCMTATGLVDGKNIYMMSQLVSPFVDTASDKTGVLLSFDHAIDNGFESIKYQAMLYVREEGGDWKRFDIEYPSVPDGETFSEFTNQTVNLSEFAGKRIQIAFEYVGRTNSTSTWRIKNISVVAADIEAPKVFAFSESYATANIGEEFIAPTLRNDFEGTVRYSSFNTDIATVDENTGAVTLVAPGQTRIDAELFGEEYLSATYWLTVIDPSSVSLPYRASFSEGSDDFTINDVMLGEGLAEVWTHDTDNMCMKAAASVDGSNQASESWLVSPVFSVLPSSSKHFVSFEQAVDNGFGDVDGEATLWVREEGGEWEPLTISHPTAPEDGSLSEFVSCEVNILKFVGKKIQIAFRYTSSAEAAGTWCIRNVSVEGRGRTFAFSASEAKATIGEEFTLPTLTNEYEGYELRYRSTSPTVATVDETTGEVTLVNRGRTSIYAELYDGDNLYRDTYYTLSVSGNHVVSLPYVENFEEGKGLFTIDDVKLANIMSGVWVYDTGSLLMKAYAYSYFESDNDVVMESWLVSPVINAETDENTLFLLFDQSINSAFDDIATGATLWVREAGGEWNQLAIDYPSVGAGFRKQVTDLSSYIGKKIQIAFKYVGSVESGGTWCIKNVQVSTDTETSKVFAFPTDYVEATIGEEFNAPKLINTYEGTVYYDSDDYNVATVDENGEVTLVGPGETAIFAVLDGEEPQEAYYVLKVIDPSTVDLPYDEDFTESAGRFTVENVMLSDGLSDVWTHDVGNQSMKATAKIDGNSMASESWLVSPIINRTYVNSLSLSFDQAINDGFGNIEEEATLWVREVDGEWEQVAIGYPTAASGFENQTVDISRYAMKRLQIAFRYTSSAETAGTWNIRNVSVKAFNRTFAFAEYEYEATIGVEFTAPALINDYEGGVRYFSSDTDVATIDENTGEVMLIGPGTTYISASLEGETYHSASYRLTVIDPSAVGVPYDESFAWEMGRFTIDDVVLGDGQPEVWTHDDDNQSMKATAKVDGNNNVSESWLVSPVIIKVADDMKLVLTFEQAIDNGFGDIETEATLWVREEGGEWQNMPIAHPAAPADGTLSEFESQKVNLSAYSGKRIQIAFKYTSNAETAGTWLVRNISVDKNYKEFGFNTDDVEAILGEEFTAPTLINDYEGEGTVVYSSNDKNVAAIDYNTGVVTLVGPGTTLIWANIVKEGEIVRSAYCTITVIDPLSVNLPYDESFTESAGKFTIDDVTLGDGLSAVWTHDAGSQSMKATAKVDGVSKVSESWLVSPVINGDDSNNCLSLSFDQALDGGFGNVGTEATLWAREENGEWQQIAIGYPSAASDFENQTVDISRYAGRRMQIAFKYTSSTDAAGTWNIRNVSVNAFNRTFDFSESYVEVTIGEDFTTPTLINEYGEGPIIYFSGDESVVTVDENTGEVTLVGPGMTQVWVNLQREDVLVACYTIAVTGEPLAFYKKVMSADELTDGGAYIILSEDAGKVMGTVGSKNSASGMTFNVDAAAGLCNVSGSFDVVLERQADGSYALRNRNGYVGCDANADLTAEAGDASEAGRQWTIGITAQGDAEIQNLASAGRYIRFDATESVFRTYTSGEGAAVQLYKRVEDGDVLEVLELWWGTNVDFRAVGNDGVYYATFSLNDDVVFPDEVEVKTVTVSNSKMTLKDVEKTLYIKEGDYSTLSYGSYVPKGSGVLLRSPKESTPYYFVLDGGSGKPLDESNMLRAVEYDGVFEAEEGYRYYKLAYDDYDKKTDLGFYYGAPDGGPFEMRMGLAYLAVPESALSQTSEAAPAHFVFGGDGDVTTIRDIEAEGNAKEPVIYNMAGQRVEAIGQLGIYFVNGKKVVVK